MFSYNIRCNTEQAVEEKDDWAKDKYQDRDGEEDEDGDLSGGAAYCSRSSGQKVDISPARPLLPLCIYP